MFTFGGGEGGCQKRQIYKIVSKLVDLLLKSLKEYIYVAGLLILNKYS